MRCYIIATGYRVKKSILNNLHYIVMNILDDLMLVNTVHTITGFMSAINIVNGA